MGEIVFEWATRFKCLLKYQHTRSSPAPAEIWPPLTQTLGCWEQCGDQFLLDGTAAETAQREGGVERTDNHQRKQRQPDDLRAEGTDIPTPAERWESTAAGQIGGGRKSPSTWNNTDHTNYNKVVIQLLLLFLVTAVRVTQRMTCLYIIHRLCWATLLEGPTVKLQEKWSLFLLKSDQVKLSITRNCCT